MAILQHTLGIFLHPESEWQSIRKQRREGFMGVFVSHVPFLALIPVICAYIGVTAVGWQVGSDEVVRLTSVSAASLCFLSYVGINLGVYVFGEFISWMERTFGVKDGAEERHYEGTAMAVYVTTPLMIAGLSLLYPSPWLVTSVMGIAGVYSVYLLYQGIPILMNIPKDQGFIFASSAVTTGLVLMVTMMIASVIVWTVGIGPVYVS